MFVETITDNRLMEQIVRETGAKIGGTLYSDALSGPRGPAALVFGYDAAQLIDYLGDTRRILSHAELPERT